MLENNDDEVMHILSDRAVNPDPQDASRLFAEWKSHNLGLEIGNEMFEKLDVLIHSRHLEDGGKIAFQKYSADAYDSGSQTGQMMNKNHHLRKERK